MKSTGQQTIVRKRRAATRKEPISWGYFVLTVFCASMMALGFFLVAVQHFVAMDLGFKNSALRKQVQDLEAEKRRLLLAKEVALSPVEITRTAAKLGFRDVDAVIATEIQDGKQTAVAVPASVNARAANAKPAVVTATAADAVKTKPVQKTASSQPVRENAESRPRRVETGKVSSAGFVATAARY